MLENFKKKSIGGDSEETKALHQEVEKQFQERFNKFKAHNTEKWKVNKKSLAIYLIFIGNLY